MSQSILLSNGTLSVNMNSDGLVNGLYFPHIGMPNHLGQVGLRHKIGVFMGGAVHWLDDGAWDISSSYLPNQLIAHTVANNSWLGLRLEFDDYVDSELNVFVRKITVTNLSAQPHNVTLFLHQAFIIDGSETISDTAQYIPNSGTRTLHYPLILHYKNDKAFAITGYNEQSQKWDYDFSVGRFGGQPNNYRDGVWCDAADGVLAQNYNECGQTDSIMGFSLSLLPGKSSSIQYYLAAGTGINDSLKALHRFIYEGYALRTDSTSDYWKSWLEQSSTITGGLDSSVVSKAEFNDSVLMLAANSNNNGAIISLPESTVYNSGYVNVHPHELASVISTLHKLGYNREAERGYDYLESVMSPAGYLCGDYLPNGQAGPSSYAWSHDGRTLPASTIETAAALWSLSNTTIGMIKSKENTAEWKRRWRKLGQPMANFLCDYIDTATKLPRPSYDIWYRKYGINTYTVAATYGALSKAADLSELLNETDNVIQFRTVADEIRDAADLLWNSRRQYFYNSLNIRSNNIAYDETVDITSLIGCWQFGLFDQATIEAALATLDATLKGSDGLATVYRRFEGDDNKSNLSGRVIYSMIIDMINDNSTAKHDLAQLIKLCQDAYRDDNLYDISGNLSRRDTMLRSVYIDACMCYAISNKNEVVNEI